jgi:dienelactone hydrolase
MFRTLVALWILSLVTAVAAAADPPAAPAASGEPLAGTAPLDWTGDIASRLVDGADRFLLRELEQSLARRPQFWKRDFASPQAYEKSVEPNRQRLAHILGVRDPRVPFDGLELAGTTRQAALVGKGTGYQVLAVRWPAVTNVHGEGLLLTPDGDRPVVADIIAIPDADQTPEMIAGLVAGVAPECQYARRLAESGCRVLVPVLINRELKPRNGRAQLTSREYLYRPAFELGRHLIGYELQKVLAGVDWFAAEAGDKDPSIGVIGWGEGGLLALYAAALDRRIDAVCVSGYFDSRQNIWQEPIDRNVFGLLEQFGDAETASLIAPRRLIVEACRGPELTLPGKGGAPARLVTPTLEAVQAEVRRAQELSKTAIELVVVAQGQGPCGSAATLEKLLQAVRPAAKLAPSAAAPAHLRARFDPAPRHDRLLREIDEHTQRLLVESPYVRQEFMKRLDTSSVEKYSESVKPYRDFFRHEVIGQFSNERLPFNPRSRKAYDKERWTGYEVVLDVFPDVIAYGILLLPKDLRPGEKRPVVVCQHGLEGRPQDIVQGNHPAYHDFAAKLAERGFITFAPQNLYIFTDRFRTLQRKANPLKKTLFSVIVPQHQQIVDWLSQLPGVDPQRIGFYGLSYGGKSAMRIPSLVENYCLSICSADFNEWVWKNASTRAPYSYVWTGEYEIFEFDLGSTFNYAEMAALIAPRPFMVERGHFDGVSSDEAVAYEFAKVRHLYSARLHLGDRTEIEWFVGPHTINGQGTYAFLHKHLRWPER